MKRQRWVMGNWKMYGSSETIRALLSDLSRVVSEPASCSVGVFPPAPYLSVAQALLKDTPFYWGAQNVFPADQGAYTGEIAGPMLIDFGCHFVLIGHSERRQYFHETDAFIAEKVAYVKTQGLIPVLCIGESDAERQQELTETVLERQLSVVAKHSEAGLSGCIIAYEPLWAIGSGKSASPSQVQAVHAWIRQWLFEKVPAVAQQTSLLYGGSVTPDNAQALGELPDVDGVLVGGASLDAARFGRIIQCIN